MAEPEGVSTQSQGNRPQRQGGRRLKQRSKVWEHFTRIVDKDGKEKAKCKRCGKEYAYHGTKNQQKHLDEGCAGQEPQPVPSLLLAQDEAMQQEQLPLLLPPPPSGPGGSPVPAWSALLSQEPGLAVEEQQAHKGPGPGMEDEDEASRDLARMIALGGHDPSVVENEYFRSFVRRLNPGFKLPPREAIEKMCDDVFTESRKNVPRSWPFLDGGIVSYAVGIAKYFEAGEVLHVTIHFVDDEWKLHRVVEDAHVLLPPGISTHCNNFLGVPVVSRGGAVERVLPHFSKWFGNPPIMVLWETTGDIGCLELKRRIEQQLMRSDETEEREVMCSTYVDHVLHSVARCLLPDSDVEKKNLSIMLDSAWTRQNRQELLSELGLDDIWEHNENWYWCYCSLKILDHEFSLETDNDILLYNIWGKIYRAMKRVSAPGTPTSALCLRELLRLRDVLRSQLPKDTEGMSDYLVVEDTAIVGLKKALETLDKALEDSYLVWSLPLVLDPRYKLRHIEESFKKVFDDSKAANYTTEVRRMIKELYTRYTDDPDGIEDGDEDSSEEMAIDDSNPFEQARDEQCHSQDDSRATTKTELKNYLEDSPALTTKGSDFDILNWWKVHGSVQYPTVAQMAKAVLAMPTCSKLTSDQTAHVRSIIRGYKEIDRLKFGRKLLYL